MAKGEPIVRPSKTLNLHPRTSAVAALAAGKLLVDHFITYLQASRQPFQYCHQSWPVGFTSSQET
jgi:hypothetical protein